MTTGDMRHGICTVCGGADVHEGELTGQLAMRSTDALIGKQPHFLMYICLGCGHTQLFYDLRRRRTDWIRRTFRHIAPRQK